MTSEKTNTATTTTTDPGLAPTITKEDAEYLDNRTLRKIESITTPEKTNDFVTKSGNTVTDVRFYPDRPTQRLHKDRFIIKEPSRYYDPCAESSKMAIRCMETHDETYKDVCTEYFQAYRECKKEWMEQRKRDNRSGGIW
ncbi:Mitochondrial copper homeostasis protein [Pichia californica]|uniref:Cytochrome c oxidase-assembly factor COX23, mitochondrial n=1 Tax=Pichia californica TaxID=460514 RepID=A0A9P7BCB1_9ASCO|nr:Mitochondrial copper homeostasis protein [[Candida] californica]KAG0686702.1 Mitochondrial copper homeostasis protein [[Candida] californica]